MSLPPVYTNATELHIHLKNSLGNRSSNKQPCCQLLPVFTKHVTLKLYVKQYKMHAFILLNEDPVLFVTLI